MAKAKRKKQATKPKAEKADWVKAMFDQWGKAFHKNDCDPLGLNDAPQWVFNAWTECCKIVFPSGLPPVEKWDAKFLGELLGRFKGLLHLLNGEVPLGAESQAELEKIKAAASKLPTLKNAKALKKDIETKIKATFETIPLATAAATSASYHDTVNFQKGMARGLEIKPDELATSRTFQRHTRTFYVLALFWRFWVTCKSLREVHRHLCNAVGEKKVGSFKTFEKHVAKKIGLKLRGRGRPPGKK
jgi:hypothetical protein